MSVQAMTWVFDHSDASGNDRCVLLVLANQANIHELSDVPVCWPSVATIAKQANCSERTVQRCIERLADLGELEVRDPGEVRPDGDEWARADRRTNVYAFIGMSRGDSLTPRKAERGVNGNGHGVSTVQLRGDTGDTRTVIEPKEEPKGSPADADELLSEFPDEVVALTRRLAAGIKRNGYPVPTRGTRTLRSWLLAMDRLLRLGPPGDGGRVPDDADEVASVIDWTVNDHKVGSGNWTGWADVIRSADNFREHYPQLYNKFDAERRSTPTPSAPEADVGWI